MNSIQQAFRAHEKVDLSIIIVNWNTGRLLSQCVQSIYDTADGLGIEIFVVDNASSDDSIHMIRSRFPRVRLIASSENVGFSRAANLALAEGKGDHFLLVHPDVRFLPGALQEMLSFLAAHPQVGIVGGNLLYPDGSYNRCLIKRRSIRQELVKFGCSFQSITKRLPWLYERLSKERDSFCWSHQTIAESEIIWNACMMFKREVLETISNFCEEFFVWYADCDWCYRAKSAGWKAYYLPRAKVIHYERQSSDYLEDGLVRYKTCGFLVRDAMTRDRYILLKRHYSPLFLWASKVIDTASLWSVSLRLALRRVLQPSR